jgi:hypothetical protein
MAMVSLRRPLAGPTALVALAALGCGLRSSPDAVLLCEGGDTEGDTEGTPRPGSCMDPIPLPPPPLPVVIRGRLGGCSDAEGWCGADGGPEDVYRLDLTQAGMSEVTVRVRPDETAFSPTIRVVRDPGDGTLDPCTGPDGLSEVCAPEADARAGWSFLAPPAVYYVHVDSAAAGGDYALDLQYGPAGLADACTFFPETIVLGNGGVFSWEDTLPRAQGEVDSFCSTPGAEHVFPLVIKNAGTLQVLVETLDGDPLRPVLSLRQDCAPSSELVCDPSAPEDGTSTLSYPFGGPAMLYLAVDQAGVSGGKYRLTVSM